jgi:hypothetical protein
MNDACRTGLYNFGPAYLLKLTEFLLQIAELDESQLQKIIQESHGRDFSPFATVRPPPHPSPFFPFFLKKKAVKSSTSPKVANLQLVKVMAWLFFVICYCFARRIRSLSVILTFLCVWRRAPAIFGSPKRL